MTGVVIDAAKEQARAVLDRVIACDVRMATLRVHAAPLRHDFPLRTDTSLSLAANYVEDGIVCVSRYDISAEPAHDQVVEKDEDHWSITVEMHGFWQLASVSDLTKAHAQAFTLAVGAMALHPYARSQVQSTITATGYPPFTLDVLQSLMEPDPDGLVELDQVVFQNGTA